MKVRNPIYSKFDNSIIDCEVNHSVFGWIPFTASPNDVEEHGRELFEKLKAGEFGVIADYVQPVIEEPPAAEPEPTAAPA